MAVELLQLGAMESSSVRGHGMAWLILIGLCLALGVTLAHRQNGVTQERQQYVARIDQLSNAWNGACLKLREQRLATVSLERELNKVRQAHSQSNKAGWISADAAKAALAKEHSSAPPPQDPKLAELRAERDSLNAELDNLTGALAKLDQDMAEVQRKLQGSEGDRAALLQELKRLTADRARLTQQFSDIASVREQLRKLKAEQAVSRRLDWIRQSTVGNHKGAELLRKGLASAAPTSQNFDLNVDLRRNDAKEPAQVR